MYSQAQLGVNSAYWPDLADGVFDKPLRSCAPLHARGRARLHELRDVFRRVVALDILIEDLAKVGDDVVAFEGSK